MKFTLPTFGFRNRRSAQQQEMDVAPATEEIKHALDAALGYGDRGRISFPIHEDDTGEFVVYLAICQLSGCIIESRTFPTHGLAYGFALELTKQGVEFKKYPCPECYREYQDALYADAIDADD